MSSNASTQAAIDRIHQYGPYGYRPSLAGSIVFCVVWAICATILAWQSIRGRRWWMLATLCFGSVLECSGNAIRIYGHFSPETVNPYIAQQVILVLTPAFFAAAHFTILTKVVYLFDNDVGRKSSSSDTTPASSLIKPMKASWLIPLFVVLDVASLAIQGAGSGLAAVAEINHESVKTVNGDGQIVTGGLAVQLAGYVSFNVIFLLFVYRANRQLQHSAVWDSKMKLFLFATWVSALLVLGRSIFRTAEMEKGWIGQVATTEWYYLAFDATLVASAVIILIIVSPTKYLPRQENATSTTNIHLPNASSDEDVEAQNDQEKRASSIVSDGAI